MNDFSNLPNKKNIMLSGNIARSLGVARGIGHVQTSRAPIPKDIEDKEIINRHKEHR